MVMERFDLSGSVAVVTGASRGIGEAAAVALADAGADVAPLARSEDALEATAERCRDAGGAALPVPADVTAVDEIRAAFDAAADHLGPVDVLVNNAGINPHFGRAEAVSPETWAEILAVNATGAFSCAQVFGRRVFDRDGTGSVVNVGSVGSIRGLPRQAPYTASKHAVAGLTRSLAVEWAPDIRVNALAPGYVKTDLTAGVRDNESIRADLLADIPQDRFAEPAEVAGPVVYLASDAASFVTGAVHVVDGGMAAG